MVNKEHMYYPTLCTGCGGIPCCTHQAQMAKLEEEKTPQNLVGRYFKLSQAQQIQTKSYVWSLCKDC